MATHNLFQGGLPRQVNALTYLPRQFPAVEPGPNDHYVVDFRKMHSAFSNTRLFDLSCPTGCVDCGDVSGSIELRNYFADNAIAAGDLINLIPITRFSLITGVFWRVEVPGTATLTLDLRIRGLAGTSVPAAVALTTSGAGTQINGAVAGSSFLSLSPPLYFDHNDMLQLVLTALPSTTPAACSGCVPNKLGGLKLWVTVVGQELIRGDVAT